MDPNSNIVIAQGGGPTAVINQSLVGAVLEARNIPGTGRVYGARHGVEGILREDFLDLSRETPTNLERVAGTPSAALGSTRAKPDRETCREIFRVLQAHDVGCFFYIGGNDSADTVRLVAGYAREQESSLQAVHIPKTIDNDLVHNDHTPGFGSAARFVACCFLGANQETRSLPGIYIGVVMGRHAGFLTASAALARTYGDDGPHLVYVPERPFDLEDFGRRVLQTHEKYGRCVIALSEGISDREGIPVSTRLQENVERDAHGNVQLAGGQLGDMLVAYLKDTLRIQRVRADTFGYLQRSFAACISETDRREAREVGEKAVHFGMRERRSGSVVIRRTGNYAVSYDLVPLEEIAAKTRLLPDAFLEPDGTGVTPEFLEYVRPLAGPGLPTAGRLAAPPVEKKLGG